MNKIAFIGAGNMASAIANGIIRSSLVPENNIILYDINTEQFKKFPTGCLHAESVAQACESANYIFFSVKPQNIKSVLNEIKEIPMQDKVFVSICAGITIQSIENIIGNQKIVRTMPNTPILLGQGVTALCKNSNVTDSEFKFVSSLFSSSGDIIELLEDEINAITAVTSSSPAYIYWFVKSMVDGAERIGLKNEKLIEIVCKTFIGSANMILSSEASIDDLIRMVKSPNGTTEKALNVFEEKNITGIIYDAMKACADRAEELSKLN